MMPSINSFRLFSLTIVVFIGICLNSTSVQAQFDDSYIRAVDASVGSCGDGTTWGSAYLYLQDALAEAAVNEDITQIWVAAGTYFPDEDCANPGGTGDWNDTFNMIDVAILGGFEGSETVAADRDPAAYETILSGDIGGVGLPGCGTGDCFTAHASAGCQNANICDYVCNQSDYEYCCTAPWDTFCAAAAIGAFPTYNNSLNVLKANNVTATSILDGFTITKGRCSYGQNSDDGAGLKI